MKMGLTIHRWKLLCVVCFVLGLTTNGVLARSTTAESLTTNANPATTSSPNTESSTAAPGASLATSSAATAASDSSTPNPSLLTADPIVTSSSTIDIGSARGKGEGKGRDKDGIRGAGKANRCPALVNDIPPEMCMMQTEQDVLPCKVNSDCTLPNQICCPHYCNTRVCKNKGGATTNSQVGGDKPTNGNGTPNVEMESNRTDIKNGDNVLPIDELVSDNVNGSIGVVTTSVVATSSPDQTSAVPVTSTPSPSATTDPSLSGDKDRVGAKGKAKRCPALVENIPAYLCSMQTRQDAMPCSVNADCAISNQICCPHYCNTRVCKNKDGTKTDSQAGNGKPKVDKESNRTDIKNGDNVPTIDELVADYVSGAIGGVTTTVVATSSSELITAVSVTPTPSLSVSVVPTLTIEPTPTVITTATSTVQPSVTSIDASPIMVPSSNNPTFQPSTTTVESSSTALPSSPIMIPSTNNPTSQPSTTTIASSSITLPVAPLLTETSEVTVSTSAAVETSVISASSTISPSSVDVGVVVTATATPPADVETTPNPVSSTQECTAPKCTNTCARYGRKRDLLGCAVCECMFNDKCPRVLPVPRVLCLVRLRMTSSTCDEDADCSEGSICCPGACGRNVCRRVEREVFRTLLRTVVG